MYEDIALMAQILKVLGREILDSRGNPTVEVDVITSSGAFGRAAVPSGASTGSREAIEKRDEDESRYLGKGVTQAVDAVNNELAQAVLGRSVLNQKDIDDALRAADDTPNKENLGANAILGVSLAVAKARAMHLGVPLYKAITTEKAITLPTPMMNVINGGSHADNSLDIQEFMVVPVGAETFKQALQMGAEVFHTLKKLLKAEGYNTAVGDEGGFAPSFKTNEEALSWLCRAVEQAGYQLEEDFVFALDAAASEFYNKDKDCYHFAYENRDLKAQELVDYYVELCDKFPIASIEDGLDESDDKGWQLITEKLGASIQLVGDDLFVTNKEILARGIDKKMANSILIKVNQIGTLTETLETMAMAQDAGYTSVVSHRSGETEDATIADLAVATNAGQIKTGSLSRTDRTAKYNQLLRIEEELGDEALYLGAKAFC